MRYTKIITNQGEEQEELEVVVWFEACGCCRSSIFWSSFSLSFLADEKSMSLALAYGTSLTYVGKIHEHFT